MVVFVDPTDLRVLTKQEKDWVEQSLALVGLRLAPWLVWSPFGNQS